MVGQIINQLMLPGLLLVFFLACAVPPPRKHHKLAARGLVGLAAAGFIAGIAILSTQGYHGQILAAQLIVLGLALGAIGLWFDRAGESDSPGGGNDGWDGYQPPDSPPKGPGWQDFDHLRQQWGKEQAGR